MLILPRTCFMMAIKEYTQLQLSLAMIFDLVEAIKIARTELKKSVIVLNPFKDTPSQELNRVATLVKPLRKGVLAASQFPSPMQDKIGSFIKPSNW